MCGIAGFILKKETSSYENNVKKINQILNLISYRGPDKKHYISDKKYSFGTNESQPNLGLDWAFRYTF